MNFNAVTSPLVLLTLAALSSLAPTGYAQELRSTRVSVQFSPDLSHLTVLRDEVRNRDYAAPTTRFPLYALKLGLGSSSETLLGDTRGISDVERKGGGSVVTALDAANRRVVSQGDAVAMIYRHDFGSQGFLEVTATIRPATTGALEWRLQVSNHTAQPVSEIRFPTFALAPLGADSTDDRLVLPQMEGALTYNPTGRPFGWSGTYPGPQSVQFTYYFDDGGGLYSAALDPDGHAKSLVLRNESGALRLEWVHRLPEVRQPLIALDYVVVTDFAGGHWQDGADLYRAWSRSQPFAAKTITERIAAGDIPAWLARPRLFVNFDVPGQPYATPESAARVFGQVQDFYGLPLVACAFGWEKVDAWVGPRYFPPTRGENYYRELVRLLRARDSFLHVMTSGFRWAVKRPDSRTREFRRRQSGPPVDSYIEYDGTADFFTHGVSAASVTAGGLLDFRKLWWVDVYMMCPGSASARALIGDTFSTLFDYGIVGVDLDQDLGCRVEPCYSLEHGHTPGFGRWQFQAMSGFLAEVRGRARPKHPDVFMAVEEPCEAYIPWLDIYHGRIFTEGNDFPVGKGHQAIPLYTYLYHPYNLGYAGWIDAGFSPFSNERIGVNRAFLFGMQPGIRLGGSTFTQFSQPNETMRVLRDTARVFAQVPEFLLAGDMLRDPVLDGAAVMNPEHAEYRPGGKAPAFFPKGWREVQATAWKSADGLKTAYAVANLSARAQHIRVHIDVSLLKHRGQIVRADGITDLPAQLETDMPVELRPWECVALTFQPE